jgi:hypothetical protein
MCSVGTCDVFFPKDDAVRNDTQQQTTPRHGALLQCMSCCALVVTCSVVTCYVVSFQGMRHAQRQQQTRLQHGALLGGMLLATFLVNIRSS